MERTYTKESISELLNNVFMDGNSVSEVIEYGESLYPIYPVKPKKPISITLNTSQEAHDYGNKLFEYEKEKKEYDEKCMILRVHRLIVDGAIVDFIKQQSGLYDVPVIYQEKVYQKAYESGHSEGYYEIFLKLKRLTDIFVNENDYGK